MTDVTTATQAGWLSREEMDAARERLPIAEGCDPDRVAAALAHAMPEPDEVTPFPRHLVDRPWYQTPYCGSCHGQPGHDHYCIECGRWDR